MHELITLCHSDLLQVKWDLKDISSYSIVNKSKCYDIPGVDDKANFEETVESLVTIDIAPEKRELLFELVVAVMHLGNVLWSDGEPCTVTNRDALNSCCRLLGVDAVALEKGLSHRTIVIVNEASVKPLEKVQCNDSRDALAKALYYWCFIWLFAELNKLLVAPQKCSNFFGILDIYGFEIFEHNSFEQVKSSLIRKFDCV
jgi:myosin heavy subunit